MTPFDISLCFVWLMRTSLRLFVRIGYASLLSFFDFLKIIIIRFYPRPVANVAFSTVTAQTLLAKKYFVVNASQCGKKLNKIQFYIPFHLLTYESSCSNTCYVSEELGSWALAIC